jgi:DNA polymerase
VALEHEVRGCVRCPLHEHRTHTAFARGTPTAELVFVGEGPGAEEDAQGLPFVGAAGQLLDRMIAAMGYGRDEIYICNVVKCRPPGNRKPTAEEMAACAPYLHEQLGLVGPQVLVALGATAVQGLLEWDDAAGFGPSITRLRGTWKLYRGRVPLMPTFHPAYLLRSPEKKRDVWSDLQSVMRRLGKEQAGQSRGRPKG